MNTCLQTFFPFFESLTHSQLLSLSKENNNEIVVENWTKWKIYVRQSPEDAIIVVYAQTGDSIAFQNKVSAI